MSKPNFLTGSEWSKWDLHIHSTASDGKGTPDQIISKAKEKGLSVIALTDHHTAKNIDAIKVAGAKEGIGVISGIEFRTEYGSKSVHMIGLFPDKHNDTILNSKALADEILAPLGLSETRIIAKAKEKNNTITDDDQAFKEGIFLVQVDFKTAADLIHKYGGLVVVHAGSKTNSIDQEIKHQGTGAKNTTLYDSLGPLKEELFKLGYIDICEIRKENDSEEFYLQTFNKPSITASDAHEVSDIGSRCVWIKANPTFEGLKQVAKEHTRIFIGDIPPLLKRVSENPQRYIKSISFEKLEIPALNEIWFDNLHLDLNPGLVAIIGNKGMGKSALADTIGLLGDTPNSSDFSFLNLEKFRKNKPNKSSSFKATLNWVSGLLPETKLLSDNPHEQAVEKVKYLPQGYLETLCNDNHANFLNELRNVIFTYIPHEKRYGQNSLEDLEKFTTDATEKEIHQIIIQIEDLNLKIAQLEKKDTASYKEHIQKSLTQKKADLDAHKSVAPTAVIPPTDEGNVAKTKETHEKIAALKIQMTELEGQLAISKQQKADTLLSKINLEKTLITLDLLQNEFIKTKREITPALIDNGLDVDIVVKLNIDKNPIESKIASKASELSEIEKKIVFDLPEAIPFQLAEKQKQLFELQSGLDEASKAYQKYLTDKEAWEKAEKEIVGSTTQFGSLKYFENELAYIDTGLNADLVAELLKRTELVKALVSKKLGILNSFRSFYQPITNFFSDQGAILKSYEIKLDVENKLVAFEDKFLAFITNNAKGSFYGTDDARRKLIEIIQQSRFESEEDIIAFLDTIVDHLKFDKRFPSNEKREVEKQLRSAYGVDELYDFIFSLNYLEPTYKLKLNEKNIEALSPGERGALLLLFYLALDRNDIPLVIDQPEENLDNQSVYNLLAQYIKKAKEKRQVIIVTHNPNLAVVCDADQIVNVRIEKHNLNKVTFLSGALENPEINNLVVDILEGTYDAFDTREGKYKVIPRKQKMAVL